MKKVVENLFSCDEDFKVTGSPSSYKGGVTHPGQDYAILRVPDLNQHPHPWGRGQVVLNRIVIGLYLVNAWKRGVILIKHGVKNYVFQKKRKTFGEVLWTLAWTWTIFLQLKKRSQSISKNHGISRQLLCLFNPHPPFQFLFINEILLKSKNPQMPKCHDFAHPLPLPN